MASNDSLSFHYMRFHPYRRRGRINPYHTQGSDSQTLNYLKNGGRSSEAKRNFQARILTWLQTKVFTDQDVAVVVAIAPGHSPTSSGQDFLRALIADLITSKARKVQDGTGLLKRKKKVKKSTEGGPRDQSLHERTIEVTDPSRQVKGKVVYIIDDVWTTGATLRACGSLMRKAGASNVKTVAVGKTVSYYDY